MAYIPSFFEGAPYIKCDIKWHDLGELHKRYLYTCPDCRTETSHGAGNGSRLSSCPCRREVNLYADSSHPLYDIEEMGPPFTPNKNTNMENKYSDRPPLNFNPAEGEYTFKVSMPKEKDVKKSSTGTPIVKVGLVSDCGAYVKAVFFGSPKALPRVAEFISAATGTRPSTAAVKDELTLADLVATASGKHIKATVKLGKAREYNGKTYQDYDVSDFKAPF
jgi:hypothetical protein